GTSVAKTILERREQFHALRLNERLDPLNPAIHELFEGGRALFMQRTGDSPLSQQMTLGVLERIRSQQALALSYFDVFWASSALAAVLLFLVLLMRRSVAERGTHIGAE